MERRITDRPEEIDIAFVHTFLTRTYWAQGRSLEDVARCVEHSLNFGLFLGDEPIGYARVVTDRTVYGYLMDVFISERHRGQGHGLFLMEHVLAHPDIARLRILRLATRDAHGLYTKLGFVPTETGNMMERKHVG
ncbi:MAG TPA: GNAT family N-acetyltransferase [Flavobacteriales bacterium]